MRADASPLFLGCFGLSMLASSVAGSLFYFYVRDVLGSEPMLALFLLLYIGAGAVGILLWNKIGNYVGVLRSWRLAMVYSSITFSAVALLKAGDDMGFAALCVISGLASGAEITMPFTIARTITAIRGAGNSGKRPWLTLAGVAKLAALIGCAPALLFIENPPILGAAWIVPLYVGVPCVLKLVAVMGWSRWIKQNGGEYEKNTLHGDVHAA